MFNGLSCNRDAKLESLDLIQNVTMLKSIPILLDTRSSLNLGKMCYGAGVIHIKSSSTVNVIMSSPAWCADCSRVWG